MFSSYLFTNGSSKGESESTVSIGGSSREP